MIEAVQQYYEAEWHFAMLCTGIGVVLVLLSLLLWRTAGKASLSRGMAYVLLAAGVFQAGTSFGYSKIVEKRSAEAKSISSPLPDREIRQAEILRMKEVFRSGYTGALLLDGALLLSGVVLVFLPQRRPTRTGVALALMSVGVLGFCIEAYSIHANRQYLRSVISQLAE